MYYAKYFRRLSRQLAKGNQSYLSVQYLAFECRDDKMKVTWVNTFNAFLYNMVTILIFDTL